MPADFEKCVKDGGKVITKSLKDNKYIHICYDKEGNSYSGEVLTKKKSKGRKNDKKIVENAKATLEDLKKLQEVMHDKYHNN